MPDIGLRIALVMMDLFVALIAIGGGIALSAGLERSRFSSELLVGTPFRTYVIPGLILAIAVGGSAALATVAAINGRHEGGVAATVAGPLLIGYIGGEMSCSMTIDWCLARKSSILRLD